MSINRKVSVGLAIQDAMEDMGLRDDRYRPKFTRWAVDAEQKIGSFYSYKRDYVNVTMCDAHRGDLPLCVVSVFGVIMGCIDTTDEAQKIFRNQYNYAQAYRNIDCGYFLSPMMGGCQYYGNRQWEIQNNCIVFLYPQTIETITLDCLVYHTDKDGLIMINDTHRDAIAQYIKMKLAEQSREDVTMVRKTIGEIADYRNEWNRKCSDARAQDSDPSASDRAEIVAMVNDPLSGCKNALHNNYCDPFYWGGIIP